jgi:hypothetical protein
MRDKWSDERLDDLNGRIGELGRRMDQGFAWVDADLREIRSEMNARFEHVEARFDALQRTMLQLGGGMIAALIGLIATQL